MIIDFPQTVPSSSAASRFRGSGFGEPSAVYESVVDEQGSTAFSFSDIGGESAQVEACQVNLVDNFDWNDPKLNKEFIKLEQKKLAGKATDEETARYQAMKYDRDASIFSERYIADYAEIQRLKILSQKIAELQKYLRPINL